MNTNNIVALETEFDALVVSVMRFVAYCTNNGISFNPGANNYGTWNATLPPDTVHPLYASLYPMPHPSTHHQHQPRQHQHPQPILPPLFSNEHKLFGLHLATQRHQQHLQQQQQQQHQQQQLLNLNHQVANSLPGPSYPAASTAFRPPSRNMKRVYSSDSESEGDLIRKKFFKKKKKKESVSDNSASDGGKRKKINSVKSKEVIDVSDVSDASTLYFQFNKK